MNYSTKENICRVDMFKPSGKWYCSLAIEFPNKQYRNPDVLKVFKDAIQSQEGIGHWEGMLAVCLHPYNEFGFPLMITL